MNTRRLQGGGHEIHPFFVAVGPAAAMEKNQYRVTRECTGKDFQRLVGAGAVSMAVAAQTRSQRKYFLLVGRAQGRHGLLGRVVVHEAHAKSCG